MHVYIDGKKLRWPRKPAQRLDKDDVWSYHRNRIVSGMFGGEEFSDETELQVYTAQQLESASTLEPGWKVTVDENGQYRIENSFVPAWTKKTLPLYIEDEIGFDQRVKDRLQLVAIKGDELPVYHFYEGYNPVWSVRPIDQLTTAIKGPNDILLAMMNKEPETEGQHIDLLSEKQIVEQISRAADDLTNKLRHKPYTCLTDTTFAEAEAYFTNILNAMNMKRDKLVDVIKAEFEDSQELLLTPSYQHCYRSTVQQENRDLYKRALKTTFKDKPDNTITKMAMLRFGLPIAALTKTNALYAGTDKDKPGPEDDDAEDFGGSQTQTIVHLEKPLEFLDYYHKRNYGHPVTRTAKSHNLDDNITSAIIEGLQEPLDDDKSTSGEDSFLGTLIGSEKLAVTDKMAMGSIASLRGGEGGRVPVYTEMGCFHLQADDKLLQSVRNLAMSVFRLKKVVDIEIDIIPLDAQSCHSRHYTSGGSEDVAMDDWLQEHLIEMRGEQIARMRLFGVGKPEDHYLPAGSSFEMDDYEVVDLEKRDTGNIAYWYLPKPRPIFGINKNYETFRNAVECLGVQDFTWVVNEGQLDERTGHVLGETPALDLWDAIVAATEKEKSKSTNKRVKVFIDDLVETQQVRIIIPGLNINSTARSIPKAEYLEQNAHTIVFNRIREAALERYPQIGQDTKLRIWQGTEEFKSGSDSTTIITLQEHKHDMMNYVQGDWSSIGQDIDAIIVLPAFNKFTLNDGNTGNSVIWRADKPTLVSFQEALLKLWQNHDRGKDVVTIQQSGPLGLQTNFLIDPEMDETRWRLQVYSWLYDETFSVFKSQENPLEYSRISIGGPLWTITSGESLPVRQSARISHLPSATVAARTRANLSQQHQKYVVSNKTNGTGAVPTMMIATESIPTGVEWIEWIAEQDWAVENRQKAFTQSQTVSGPSGTRVVQLGAISGSSINAGSYVPTSFTTTKSRYQILELEKKVRCLQNIVLDREVGCQLCTATFTKSPPGPEQFTAHIQQHINQLKDHTCPYCQVDDWRTWSEETRRTHISRLHTNSDGTRASVNVTTRFPCPYESCTERLGQGQTVNNGNAILDHLSKHGTNGDKLAPRLNDPEQLWCECCGTYLTGIAERRKLSLGEAIHSHLTNECLRVGTDADDDPHFCQYCAKDIWSGGLSPAEAVAHVESCKLQRETSPLNIFRLLLDRLSRSIAGEADKIMCYFRGCAADLTLFTKTAIQQHYKDHIVNNDIEQRSCHISSCNEDLSALDPVDLQAHYAGHVPEDKGTGKSCHFCRISVAQMNDQQLQDHYLNVHFPPIPVELACDICSQPRNTLTEAERVQHTQQHVADAQYLCAFPRCEHQFRTTDDEEVHRVHFRTHLPVIVVAALPAEVTCPSLGCDHQIQPGDSAYDIRAHLQTHFAVVIVDTALEAAAPEIGAKDNEEGEEEEDDEGGEDRDDENDEEFVNEDNEDEDDDDNLIPEGAADVPMPQRMMDEAIATGRSWYCPHELHLALRNGKNPGNFIKQMHLDAVSFHSDYPRVSRHTEWILLGKGKEIEEARKLKRAEKLLNDTPKSTPGKTPTKKKTSPKVTGGENKASPKVHTATETSAAKKTKGTKTIAANPSSTKPSTARAAVPKAMAIQATVPRITCLSTEMNAMTKRVATPATTTAENKRPKKRKRQSDLLPTLVTGDGALIVSGAEHDEDSRPLSGTKHSTRNATKRYRDTTTVIESLSKKQKIGPDK